MKCLIFRPWLTRYWRKQLKNQHSETWNQNLEIRNLKPEFRNQISKSQFLKIWNPQLRNQKSNVWYRNVTCDTQFWQSRFIPVCDVIISNLESVKSSTFPFREWVNWFECYSWYRFSKRGEGEYFLTSCVNNFSWK